jgi:hypothetical protein
MAKLVTVLRLLVAFVLGALIGILGTVGTAYFYPDVTDSFIAKSPGVEELRRDLDTVVAQRDDMTRRLEKLASLLEQVERRYADLGQRFSAIEASGRGATPAAAAQPVQPAAPVTGGQPAVAP